MESKMFNWLTPACYASAVIFLVLAVVLSKPDLLATANFLILFGLAGNAQENIITLRKRVQKLERR